MQTTERRSIIISLRWSLKARYRLRTTYYGLMFVIFLCIAPCCPASAEDVGLRAGVAYTAFTLPKWVPLAGYSRRGGSPSKGMHDELGVRALVLQEEDSVAVLVSADLLIIDERIFGVIERRLKEAGLPEGFGMILAATHTHSGPGAYGRKFFEKLSMGHYDPAVFNSLVETIVATVLKARSTERPVRIVSANRLTEKLVVNRVIPDGVVDSELIVTAFYEDFPAAPYAVLVNFSAHPTTLGSWNMQLSSDYPGVLAREIERQFTGLTCLFFAGSVGDQAPRKEGQGFEPAEHLGGLLAQQVALLLKNAVDASEPRKIAILSKRLVLPPARVRIGRFALPRWLGRRFVDDDATLTVIAVGRAVFIGVPCDLSSGLGEQLKRVARSRGLEPMVIGFASDYIGYCIPSAQYDSGSYEASLAFNGPRAGELVVENLAKMINQLDLR